MTPAEEDQDNILRITANNPGPLTGTGTNSYILGQDSLAIIDPGPNLPGHLAALLQACRGRTVAAILVTHHHADHSALAPALARATGAPVYGFDPRRRPPPTAQTVPVDDEAATEAGDAAFTPDIALSDGDMLDIAGLSIQALHTPGHTACHLCFALQDQLFSGDHVMGWSTSLISPPDGNMAAYMASLARLSQHRWTRFHPGHGPMIADPADRLAQLTRHRLQREAAVLRALLDGPATPQALAARIYTDISANLLPAAAHNVLAHLVKLVDEGKVAPASPNAGPLASFRLSQD